MDSVSQIQVVNANDPIQVTSDQLDINNVNCFGENSGSIDITVQGGVPPYDFFWSNGVTEEDLTDIGSGYIV